jgi:energy-coupling factor transporter ATP-binding protein EcfA2
MESTRDAGSNPFATRFIRPGVIPYLFPPGVSAESLVAALAAQNWRGAIIGPHGSGKSSLLVALKPVLEARGRKVISQQLQGGEKQVRWGELDLAGWTSQVLLIIDGYEQLSSWQRLLLQARCRLSGAGLLVTAHQPVGLQAIFTTKPTAELTQSVVNQLLPEEDVRILASDIEREFVRTKGDVRETLLALYDVYRARS